MVRLTAELIAESPQFTNPVKDRELDLRGNLVPNKCTPDVPLCGPRSFLHAMEGVTRSRTGAEKIVWFLFSIPVHITYQCSDLSCR